MPYFIVSGARHDHEHAQRAPRVAQSGTEPLQRDHRGFGVVTHGMVRRTRQHAIEGIVDRRDPAFGVGESQLHVGRSRESTRRNSEAMDVSAPRRSKHA